MNKENAKKVLESIINYYQNGEPHCYDGDDETEALTYALTLFDEVDRLLEDNIVHHREVNNEEHGRGGRSV